MTWTLRPGALAAFRDRLHGRLVCPDDSSYDAARRVWNGRVDRRPAIIALCSDTMDVVAAVHFAHEHELVAAVRGGGHSVAGTAVCDGGLVIDLSLMKSVEIDPVGRSARAQAGVRWSELDGATQAFSLAVPGGTDSEVGIAGLTLGGGNGWLMGLYGATCDNLLAAEVVMADGRIVCASSTDNPDLFWALRGGGGNFGIVTSFRYRLYPVGPTVIGGAVLYAYKDAVKVLRHFREFGPLVPDPLTVLSLILRPPGRSAWTCRPHCTPAPTKSSTSEGVIGWMAHAEKVLVL